MSTISQRITAAGIVILVILYIISIIKVSAPVFGGGLDTNTIYAPMSATSVSCAYGASTLLLATSSSRQFVQLSNTGPASVWIAYGTSAATGTGTLLTSSTTLTLGSVTNFGGAIYCLGAGAAASVAISESK